MSFVDFRREAIPGPKAPGDEDYDRAILFAVETRAQMLRLDNSKEGRANAQTAYNNLAEAAWKRQRALLAALRIAADGDSFGKRETPPALPVGWPSTVPGRD